MARRVLVTARSFARTSEEPTELLRAAGCQVDVEAGPAPLTAAELKRRIAGYHGAILGLDACDASVLDHADALRVVSRQGVGTDNVDIEAATRRGIAVTITPGTNSVAVAELTLALTLALARRLRQHLMEPGRPQPAREMGWQLGGRTLGLVGFGAIGREVARRAGCLGMRVLAHDPYVQRVPEGLDAELVDLDALLAEADVVSLHTALTDATRGLIGAPELARMKAGACLVNTARAGLVDEAALERALREGRLRGAASDVLDEVSTGEASGASERLLEHPDFIATPHVAATTEEAAAATSLLAARNLIDVLEGRPCEHVVNPDALDPRSPT